MVVSPNTYYAIQEENANFDDVSVADLTVTGTSTQTGAITGAGGFVGDLTGDVAGDLTGNSTGEHTHSNQELTASGAITLNSGLVTLNHISVIIEATLDAPVVGNELFILDFAASGTAAHTVTLPAGVTWDGTNNTATFNAVGEALDVIALSATRWFIKQNIGAVALSTV